MNQQQTWVQAIGDDRPCPLTGLVLGWEDDERVWVLWGDAAVNYQPPPAGHPFPPEARIENMDELTTVRRS